MKKQNVEIGLYVTAMLLAVGVFLPLTTLTLVGEVTYKDVAEIEAYLIVLSAMAGVVLSVASPRLTAMAAVGTWVVLLFPAIESKLKSNNGGMFSKIQDQAQGVLQDFAADLLPDLVSNIASFHWGGFVFLAGLFGFTAFSVMRSFKG